MCFIFHVNLMFSSVMMWIFIKSSEVVFDYTALVSKKHIFDAVIVFVVQVYARPEATEAGHTKYATEITPKILDFYESHLDLRYDQRNLCKTLLDLFLCQILNRVEFSCFSFSSCVAWLVNLFP